MEEPTVDYYALLAVAADASTKQIRTAYRQKSLKVHPDRNPDNPEAAHLFHELTIAHEILIDPAKRDSYDKIYKARQARAERFKSLDNKRKNMAEDLAAREEAYKKAKLAEKEAERNERFELERLKEEGQKLRKMKEEQMTNQIKEQREEHKRRQAHQAQVDTALGPLDTTIRLKWPRKRFPTLEVDPKAIEELLAIWGISSQSIDSVVISSKMAANPKLKFGTAMVALKNLSAAVKAIEGAGTGEQDHVEATWASGKEPELVKKARHPAIDVLENGHTKAKEASKRQVSEPLASPPRMSQVDEDSILEQFRLRERERERLEEEIRRQDAEEEEGRQV